MRGETSLQVLLADMRPVLREGTYAFCLLPAGHRAPAESFATVIEDEGTTAIVPLDLARQLRLEPLYVASCVTLTVHSALEAVGLLAAVTAELAGAGISCNVVSAVHHDHLFVPAGRGGETIEILSRLAATSIQST